MPADNEATLNDFKRDITDVLRGIVHGNTISAGCGEYKISVSAFDGGVIHMSRATAVLILEKLEGAK